MYKIRYIRSSERYFKILLGLACHVESAWIKSINSILDIPCVHDLIYPNIEINKILEKRNPPVQPSLRSNPYQETVQPCYALSAVKAEKNVEAMLASCNVSA
jgi:hypothetical protein